MDDLAKDRGEHSAAFARKAGALMELSAIISSISGLFDTLNKLLKGVRRTLLGHKFATAKKQRGKRLQRLRIQCGAARAFAEERSDETLSAQAFGAAADVDDIDHLLAVESGTAEFSLKDLRSLCRTWNLPEEHVLDGIAPPWAHLVTDMHVIDDVLPKLDASISRLYPVRVRAPDGHVAFILDGGDWRRPRVIHFTNFHFGSEVGGGGAYDQYQFYLLRGALRPESRFLPIAIQERVRALRAQHRLHADLSFLPSLETTSEKFADLVNGHTHPMAFLHSEFWASRTEWFNFFEDAFHQSPIARTYTNLRSL